MGCIQIKPAEPIAVYRTLEDDRDGNVLLVTHHDDDTTGVRRLGQIDDPCTRDYVPADLRAEFDRIYDEWRDGVSHADEARHVYDTTRGFTR